MDFLSLCLILLIALAMYLIFKSFNKNNIKNKIVKKEEIIEAYFLEMKELLSKYDNDKIIQAKEKIRLLKRINNELAMNIFFEKEEAIKLLEKLSKL